MGEPVRYGQGSFHRDVRDQVTVALARTGRGFAAGWRGWLRLLPAVVWFYGSYLLLVFASPSPPLVVALAVSMGLAITATLTNVVHEAEHLSLAKHRWVNLSTAYLAAPFGLSGSWWAAKHNLSHHAFTHIAGHDTDLEHTPWMRLSTEQEWHAWYRYQHLYIWVLSPFLWLSMVLLGDAQYIVHGRLKNGRQVAPNSAVCTLGRVVEKLAGAAVLVGVACLFHPWAAVVGVAILAMLFTGVTLAPILAVGHYVDTATFPDPDRDGSISEEWAVSQVRGAANVRLANPVLRWYFGGMHHHIEHHLFPLMGHAHYPVIAPIVREQCAARGIPYQEFASLRVALGAHTRFLRLLGQPPPAPELEQPPVGLVA